MSVPIEYFQGINSSLAIKTLNVKTKVDFEFLDQGWATFFEPGAA